MKKSTRILIPTLLLALAAGLLPACNKEAVQLAYDKQETNIASFVEAQLKADKTAKVTYKDGVVRVVLHDTLQREGLLRTPASATRTCSPPTIRKRPMQPAGGSPTRPPSISGPSPWTTSCWKASGAVWKASGTRTSATSSFPANMPMDPRPKARFLQGQPWFTTFG